LLTEWMEDNWSWEADWPLSRSRNSPTVSNTKVHYPVHKKPLLDPVPRYLDSVHIRFILIFLLQLRLDLQRARIYKIINLARKDNDSVTWKFALTPNRYHIISAPWINLNTKRQEEERTTQHRVFVHTAYRMLLSRQNYEYQNVQDLLHPASRLIY
jgi:hypothetical protein